MTAFSNCSDICTLHLCKLCSNSSDEFQFQAFPHFLTKLHHEVKQYWREAKDGPTQLKAVRLGLIFRHWQKPGRVCMSRAGQGRKSRPMQTSNTNTKKHIQTCSNMWEGFGDTSSRADVLENCQITFTQKRNSFGKSTENNNGAHQVHQTNIYWQQFICSNSCLWTVNNIK